MPGKCTSNTVPAFALRLAVLAATFATVAQPCFADNKAQAKAKFKEGMEMIAKENYLGALQAFEASYKLLPKPALLYNIGMCQKALFRYVDSIATFEKYRAKAGDKIKPAMATAVEDALAEMQRLVGKLSVEEAPEGAEILIDGKAAGRAPFTEPLILDPGRHTVQVSANGYRTLRTEVTVASGAIVPLRASLSQVEAWLEVVCDDEKAIVRLDAKVVGSCPYEGEVPPGSHAVKVTSPDGETFEQTVDVTAGGTTSVSVTPAGKDDKEQPEVTDGEVSPMSIGGWTCLGLGLGAGVLGAVFHVRGTRDEEDLAKLSKTDNKKAYDATKSDLKADQAMTIVGYSLAGALVATGVVLLVIDSADGETQEQDVVVAPAPGGLAVSF